VCVCVRPQRHAKNLYRKLVKKLLRRHAHTHVSTIYMSSICLVGGLYMSAHTHIYLDTHTHTLVHRHSHTQMALVGGVRNAWISSFPPFAAVVSATLPPHKHTHTYTQLLLFLSTHTHTHTYTHTDKQSCTYMCRVARA